MDKQKLAEKHAKKMWRSLTWDIERSYAKFSFKEGFDAAFSDENTSESKSVFKRQLLIDFVKYGSTPAYWEENKKHEIEQIDLFLNSLGN